MPKPSTTIEFDNKRGGGNTKKIKLRKNSFTLNCLRPTDISSGLSDFTKSYVPDFGYSSQLEFDRQTGWAFLLDFVSKYPKREKTANMIREMHNSKIAKVSRCEAIIIGRGQAQRSHKAEEFYSVRLSTFTDVLNSDFASLVGT